MLVRRLVIFSVWFVVMFICFVLLTVFIFRRTFGAQALVAAIWGSGWVGVLTGILPSDPVLRVRRGQEPTITDSQGRIAIVILLVGLAAIFLLVE